MFTKVELIGMIAGIGIGMPLMFWVLPWLSTTFLTLTGQIFWIVITCKLIESIVTAFYTSWKKVKKEESKD